MARMHFLAHGVRLGYGSFEEQAAMVWFNRMRAKERLEFFAMLVDPDSKGVQTLVKDYNEIVFPDSRVRDIQTMAKQKQILDKLKQTKLYARPE